MPVKYFQVDFDIDKVNKLIGESYSSNDYEDLKINTPRDLLEILIEGDAFIVEDIEEFGEDWSFSLHKEIDIIRVNIPDHSFTKYKNYNEAFCAYLKNLQEEGLFSDIITGATCGYKTFTDWRYKEITGPGLLMLVSKERQSI